jgi:hypothetical protein
MSRSQRIPATRLCTRHKSGDGTSIRVWCSHVGWPLHTEIKSGHSTDGRLRRHSHGGKKFKKSAHKGSVSLDKKRPSKELLHRRNG